ncbi:MAG TPA: DNA-binding domain-containing protein [Paracoccaceae bacterium]|nr:DNA-binding domain-containing protein [Paracoccaceae bacterium]
MTEAAFRAALFDPAAAVPAGLTGPGGRAAGARFDVYRNNVVAGLTAALEEGFPTVRALVGEAFFAAMAGVFLRAHPPASRLMMLYGADFPGFLADFPPVAALPYLPDVARLDLALRQSYHAADATPADLSALPPARMAAARLRLAPALRLVRSAWPVWTIRAAHHGGPPPAAMRPEDALILRPALAPEAHLLPPGGGLFVASLMQGAPVAAAMQAAGPAHDLSATLTILVGGGAIVEILE